MTRIAAPQRVARDRRVVGERARDRHVADAAQAVEARDQIDRTDRHLALDVEAVLAERVVEPVRRGRA